MKQLLLFIILSSSLITGCKQENNNTHFTNQSSTKKQPESMELITPHIPLNVTLEEGITILKSVSDSIDKEVEEDSTFYKVITGDFECGFYEKNGVIIASWYNDPAGRDSKEGINLKVSAYLNRYGSLNDWEDGINNGWIQFFNNNKTKVGLAYGINKDVLRFNYLD